MKKKRLQFTRKHTLYSIEQALEQLIVTHGGKTRIHLNALWENWNHVMGEDIARLGCPLGHNKTTLLIGAEDNMAMQEIAMQTWEILERANTFMDEEFFTHVKASLMQGRQALARPRGMRPDMIPSPAPLQAPANLGGLLPTLNTSLHYAHYYAAYVNALKE